MASIVPAPLTAQDRVVVLTGAGISADSGIATFRGAGGLWRQYDVFDLASVAGFERDPGLVWQFIGGRRSRAEAATPNAGHLTLARLGRELGPERFTLLTQNVDGLHQRAGSEPVYELHGSLFRTRCSAPDCPAARQPFSDNRDYPLAPPTCAHCGAPLRPDVVWFGEALAADVLAVAEQVIQRCTWFFAVGTSGTVFPAAAFVELALAVGAHTVLVNREPAENVSRFEQFVEGRAAEVLPLLFPDGRRAGQDAG